MVSSTGSAIGSGSINIINTTQTTVRFVVINTSDTSIDYSVITDDPRVVSTKQNIIQDSGNVGTAILVTGLLPNVSYKLSVTGSTCEAEASFKTKNYSPPTITYISDSDFCISIFASNPDEDPLPNGAVYNIGVSEASDPSIVLLPFAPVKVSARVCLEEPCTTFHIYSYIQYSYDESKSIMDSVIYQIGPAAIYLFDGGKQVQKV